jgi:hypothetical protein
VDIKIKEASKKVKKVREATTRQNIIMLSMTILLAMFGLVFAMYFNEIGPFHASVSFSFLK